MRIRLAAMMAAMLLVLVAAVALGSPYVPVVGAYREIEELWEIEDAREESETPLVTRLECNGAPMAYDAQENRFYCVLGLGHGSEWPDLHITAPGAGRSLQLCFADDYAYDWCDQAIEDGYPYLLMAYTPTQYAYFEVVFTGLPVLSLTVDVPMEDILREDVPAMLDMASADDGLSAAPCRIHRRGSAAFFYDKPSYRLEFTRSTNGHKKVTRDMPVFGEEDTVLLLACWSDPTMMRDRLCWELYERIADASEPFAPRQTAYVELLINGEYQGVYLMMEPFDLEKELTRRSAAATDSVYRSMNIGFLAESEEELGVLAHPLVEGSYFQSHYHPSQGDRFAALADYIDLLTEEDDEAFAQKAAARIDIDSILRYTLYMQATGAEDNVTNNLYIWAHPTGGHELYRFAPWDMDQSWQAYGMIAGEEAEKWIFFPVADRIINLDVNGARERLARFWKGFTETAFNIDTVQELTQRYADELNGSGAYARNSWRWGMSGDVADGFGHVVFASMRLPKIDEAVRIISETDGEVAFLVQEDVTVLARTIEAE